MNNRSFGSNENMFGPEVNNSMNEEKVNQKKGKRSRCAFTTNQVIYLEKEFKSSPYINSERRNLVASELDISERAVKIWFQNRRMREKKDLEEKYEDYCDSLISNLNVIASNERQSKSSSEVRLNLSLPQCFESRSNLYRCKSPDNESHASGSSEAKCESFLTSKTAGEFSIDLLRKYKEEPLKCTTYLSQNKRYIPTKADLDNDNLEHTFPFSMTPQNLPTSSKTSTCIMHSESNTPMYKRSMYPERNENTGRITYPNGFVAPHYIPPPGPIMWKPINVPPALSTGYPVINMLSTSSHMIQSGQQNVGIKCNCNCHKPPILCPIVIDDCQYPQNQYVAAAAPLQDDSHKLPQHK